MKLNEILSLNCLKTPNHILYRFYFKFRIYNTLVEWSSHSRYLGMGKGEKWINENAEKLFFDESSCNSIICCNVLGPIDLA